MNRRNFLMTTTALAAAISFPKFEQAKPDVYYIDIWGREVSEKEVTDRCSNDPFWKSTYFKVVDGRYCAV